MKKQFFVLAAAASLALVSCKKTETETETMNDATTEVNTDTVAVNTTTETNTTTTAGTVNAVEPASGDYVYTGSTTPAKVTYARTTDTTSTLTINRNGVDIVLDRNQDGVFERDGVRAEVNGNTIQLNENGKLTELKINTQ